MALFLHLPFRNRAVGARNRKQPYLKAFGSGIVAVAFCGELYNSNELRTELKHLGHSFQSSSDKEILLESYLEWGMDFVKRLNGIFAFAICDTACQTLLLFRDRIGSKPLFYTVLKDGELAFSSRIRPSFLCPKSNRNWILQAQTKFSPLGLPDPQAAVFSAASVRCFPAMS